MLARGRPFWAVAGALLFGLSLSIADWAQVANFYFGLPSSTFTDVVFMLPFILVLVVLVVFGRRAYLPAALALPYERGTR
jgi:simple sugar transport system permease protein